MMKQDKFKTLGYGLIIVAVLFACLILAKMWAFALSDDLFIRMIISLACCAVYGIYLGMVWDDMDKSRYRQTLLMLAVSGGVSVCLILLQLWTEFLSWPVFSKALGSLVVISGTISFILSVREDFFNNKRLKDEDYID